jgi:folate-binding protein YgfZ
MDAIKMDVPAVRTAPQPTALSFTLSTSSKLIEFSGALTAEKFAPLEQEMHSLLHVCGVFDLGWRARISVRGEDRLRWLSGMVTNAVQQLGDGEGNYSFFLNAQGRILGDAFVYRDQDQILLDTTIDQVDPLMAHLDHFIIMDDVTLEDGRGQSSVLGVGGPGAAQVLTKIGLTPPLEKAAGRISFHHAPYQGNDLDIVVHPGVLAPQFEIFCPADQIGNLWQQLLEAGAKPCGVRAVEGLRVMEGLPRYGVDITDRDLPQETGQKRALNFTKGCYIGQEIVERIRSRGAVRREMRQFFLEGDAPSPPSDLLAAGEEVGRITSAVSLTTSTGPLHYGLGIVRSDALNQAGSLTYNGGQATALEHTPPVPLF